MDDNWFERLTGFTESSYEATRQQLFIEGDRLRSWPDPIG